MRRHVQRIIQKWWAALPLSATLAIAGCSSIDCPLNNRVAATCKWADGDAALGSDTLTVSTLRSQAEGDDSVLVNKVTAADSITLPMSYTRTEDVYYFALTLQTADGETKRSLCDTVRIQKQNEPHFDAVDCAPTVFHTVTGISCTHNAIDSIQITNNHVTYNDAKAHFLIYFKTDRH